MTIYGIVKFVRNLDKYYKFAYPDIHDLYQPINYEELDDIEEDV